MYKLFRGFIDLCTGYMENLKEPGPGNYTGSEITCLDEPLCQKIDSLGYRCVVIWQHLHNFLWRSTSLKKSKETWMNYNHDWLRIV